MARNLLILLCFVLNSLPAVVQAQTCCSGGVSIASNPGLPAAEAHHLQVTFSYDLNVLRTLKEGLEKPDDDSRNRTMHAVLWELGCSITDRLSIDALFSYVCQERTISNDLSQNFVFTDGPGGILPGFDISLSCCCHLNAHRFTGVRYAVVK